MQLTAQDFRGFRGVGDPCATVQDCGPNETCVQGYCTPYAFLPPVAPSLISQSTPIPNWALLLAAAFLVGWFVQAPYAGGKRK